jgi:glucokinase
MFISADIGGSRTRVASSKNLESIYKVKRFDTPQTFDELRLGILEAIVEVSEEEDIDDICVGVPGILDHRIGSIKKVPNIWYLDDKSFDSFFIDESLVSKVIFENDAYLAGLAEATVGAGKDYKTVGYITLSTGVGGALIQDKKLPKYPKSYEPGHMIMDHNSEVVDRAGVTGSMETILGGSFFEKNYGVRPEDTTYHEIWEDYGAKLAKAMANVCVMWDPEVIVLGGSISNKFELFHPTLKQVISSFEYLKVPKIEKSQLMDDAGLMGGLFYLERKRSKRSIREV